MPCGDVTIRPAMPHDWERVTAVMVEWWGGRDLRALLPRVFFEHFGSTSLIVEHEDQVVAFLVGFLCPTHADEAYIHVAGVHPAWRRVGLARDLYDRFARVARSAGRDVVRAITSPADQGSMAFHQRLGFSLVAGDTEVDGVPVHLDQGWTDDGVVKFELRLTQGEPPEAARTAAGGEAAS